MLTTICAPRPLGVVAQGGDGAAVRVEGRGVHGDDLDRGEGSMPMAAYPVGMGYVTNDPKKADEQQPGGSGLMMDMGLMACPQCRREVPAWQDECPDCAVQAVARTSLASVMPDIPAHLLVDEDEAEDPAQHNG